MATYKVIQDVEAEDKILGPLTLRQFIYAGVAAIMLYLSYFVATHGLVVMLAVFLPIAFIFGFFAFPWGRDQPTEIWALAKIRFMLKPRKRIWDQSGVKELVTITAPKQLDTSTVNHLSQTEVRSRLKALAETIDSRGWAIKNANLNAYAPKPLILQQPGTSDRLLEVNASPAPQVYNIDVQASDDMLDEKANPRAQRVDSMISASAKAHRQKLLDELRNEPSGKPEAPANYWFLNQPSRPVTAPSGSVTFNTQVVTPGVDNDVADDSTVGPTPTAMPDEDEQALVHELDSRRDLSPNASYYGHLRTIQPMSVQREQAAKKAAEAAHAPKAAPTPPPPPTPPEPPVTPAKQAAILQLAGNNDLNITAIAHEANRSEPNDEVVIKLH